MAMKIRDDGSSNPLIIISPDEVLAWLRQKADEAGYADRETCTVQSSFRVQDPASFRYEAPELILMVSNIKGSRTVAIGQIKNDR